MEELISPQIHYINYHNPTPRQLEIMEAADTGREVVEGDKIAEYYLLEVGRSGSHPIVVIARFERSIED